MNYMNNMRYASSPANSSLYVDESFTSLQYTYLYQVSIVRIVSNTCAAIAHVLSEHLKVYLYTVYEHVYIHVLLNTCMSASSQVSQCLHTPTWR